MAANPPHGDFLLIWNYVRVADDLLGIRRTPSHSVRLEHRSSPLFASQSRHWIDPYRTTSRQVGRGQRDARQQHRNHSERQRIFRLHPEQLIRHKARQSRGGGKTGNDAGQRHPQALPEHRPHHIAASGAERNSNTDLMCTPPDRVVAYEGLFYTFATREFPLLPQS